MSIDKPCNGCIHKQDRFKRFNTTSLWCVRFHKPAAYRCIDYRTSARAIKAALDYIKRSSIK